MLSRCANTEEVKSKIKMKDNNFTPVIVEILIRRIMINNHHRGYYLFIKDITNEEVWKENIKRQSMINKSIVENARDGILLLNSENKIIYINEKVESIIEGNQTYLGMNVEQALYRLHGNDIGDNYLGPQGKGTGTQHLEFKNGQGLVQCADISNQKFRKL